MVKMKEDRLAEISVSDPSRELSRFNLSVSAKIDKQEKISRLSGMRPGHNTYFHCVATDNYAGDSVTIQLN